MATVIGGIGSSHAPTIGTAWDKGQQKEAMWAPLFDGYVPVRQWLEEVRPDVFLIVYNDHANRFFFDAYPTFALGVGAVHTQADEGWGKRPFGDLPGHPDLGWHLARSLVDDEFDPTICQEMSLDHGVLSFLPMLTDTDWKIPVVPLAVNVIQHPIPSARRLFKLGQALRRGIESFPRDLRVVVFGTGGLTHQLSGGGYGTKNAAWDNEFMDRLEIDPASLAGLSIQEYMERGGTEGVEMIMWLAMRGALSPKVQRVHRNYTAPLLTGYGLLALAE
jgi:protocatechuate 4,5-dioxygenase beta chain